MIRHALIGYTFFLFTLPLVFAEELPVPEALPLATLVAEALQRNPEIQAAAREREAARERIPQAGALEDPMLEAGVVNLPVESLRFDREPMTMKMVGLSQKLPYPGKRGLREAVAAKDAEAASYAYQEAVNRVVREVKLAYYELGLIDESARITRKNQATLKQFLQLARARYEVGLGSQADVLKAQTQLAKMDDELIRLARERQGAEAELARALGRSSLAGSIAAELPRLQEASLPPLDTLKAEAAAKRPQLLALRSLAARNEKALKLARKDYYPDFDLKLSYGQRDNLPGQPQEDLVSVTVAIDLPVWRKAKLAPRVAEAEAMRQQALSQYQAQENETGSRLRQAWADAQQSLKSARLYETAILPQARLAVEAALAAYQVGRVDFLTLLDSQMAVFNYETAYAGAVTGYNKALAEIEFLTGRQSFSTAIER